MSENAPAKWKDGRSKLKTRMIPIDEHKLESEAVDEVCAILRAGGVVALPTETVYGLAANALDADAVRKIFAAKGRPQDNPLIVHVADLRMMEPLVREIPKAARTLAARFWPGPLTMVLEKSAAVPLTTSGGLGTVGVRMPSHPVIRAVLARGGLPLAAPSANRSGAPSTTTAQHCIDDLDGRVDAIVVSSDCAVGVESTVVSLVTEPPRVLRPGAVTPEMLAQALDGPVALDGAVTGPCDAGVAPGAPGMKYRHYCPAARVRLVRGGREAFQSYIARRAGEAGAAALCPEDEREGLALPSLSLGRGEEEMARALFAALRECDRKGVQTVYVHCPEPTGVGLAVYNRLLRAAAFDVTVL